MSRFFLLTAVIVSLSFAAALAQDEGAGDLPEGHPLVGSQAAPQIDLPDAIAELSPDQQLSYALGYVVALDMERQGIELDSEQFVAGLRQSLGEEQAELTQQQAMALFQQLMMRKQMEQMAQARQQSTENVAAGEAFRERYAQQENVAKTDSDLLIKTIEQGEGAAPQPGDVVTVHYEGRLIDDTVFDSSFERGEPLIWDPRQFQVIPGWQEGLTHMNVGGTYELVIPADLAYGDQPAGDIPPGSTLVFKIELIDTQPPDDAGAMPPIE